MCKRLEEVGVAFTLDFLRWLVLLVNEDAQKVRDAARRAVHTDPPRDEECRDLFLKTRMVMHMLYRKP